MLVYGVSTLLLLLDDFRDGGVSPGLALRESNAFSSPGPAGVVDILNLVKKQDESTHLLSNNQKSVSFVKLSFEMQKRGTRGRKESDRAMEWQVDERA